MGILIILVLYTLAILLFVPLDKIGSAQKSVKTTTRRWLSKLND